MVSHQSKQLISKMIRLLASENDGEIIAAVSAIKRILNKEKKDFNDLAEMFFQSSGFSYADLQRAYSYSPQPQRKPRQKKERKPETEEEIKLKKILSVKEKLPEKSREFIDSVSARINEQEEMTEKQKKWFNDIYFRFCC